MFDFIAESAFEIGRRLEVRGPQSGAWFVITFATSDAEAIVDFKSDVEAAANLAFTVFDVNDFPLEDLLSIFGQSDNDGALVSGFGSFDQARWSAWDINRSRFVRPGPIVLWLSYDELAKFCKYAPNLKSFVGGSFFTLTSSGEPLSAAERSQRIQELEQHYGIPSLTIVESAEKGILAPDPHFVEWLILLDRGDLV